MEHTALIYGLNILDEFASADLVVVMSRKYDLDFFKNCVCMATSDLAKNSLLSTTGTGCFARGSGFSRMNTRWLNKVHLIPYMHE